MDTKLIIVFDLVLRIRLALFIESFACISPENNDKSLNQLWIMAVYFSRFSLKYDSQRKFLAFQKTNVSVLTIRAACFLKNENLQFYNILK